jgi:hypothetical protein
MAAANINPKSTYAEDTFTCEERSLIARARRELRQGKYVTLAHLERDLLRKLPRRR